MCAFFPHSFHLLNEAALYNLGVNQSVDRRIDKMIDLLIWNDKIGPLREKGKAFHLSGSAAEFYEFSKRIAQWIMNCVK